MGGSGSRGNFFFLSFLYQYFLFSAEKKNLVFLLLNINMVNPLVNFSTLKSTSNQISAKSLHIFGNAKRFVIPGATPTTIRWTPQLPQ